MDAEGYFKSGDIGYIKENGFVYVVDRKKDIFKFKAFHINPSDIENVIQSIDGVEYVTVFGIPNAETYSFAAAMIEKKKGFEKLKEEDVISYVAARLPEHQQLHGGVYFVEKMPMTKNDKISKRDARDMVMKIVAGNQKKTE